MCILLSTTDHPDYPLIILSNRDEFFARPTQLATLRTLKNGTQLLAPLDLARPEHGTWIGVTSLGRVAVLVNYREMGLIVSEVSRGILPLEYLESDFDNDDEWYDNLEHRLTSRRVDGKPTTLSQIGGFSLVYGTIQVDPANGRVKPLNIMSNRGDRGKIHSYTECSTDLHEKVARMAHFGLSNSLYYNPWKKVTLGVSLLENMVSKAVAEHYSLEQVVESCYEILSTNTYDPEVAKKDSLFSMEKLAELQNSIFIPPIDYGSTATMAGTEKSASPSPLGQTYGTRTQTLVIYHKSGTLHYVERDLQPDGHGSTKVDNRHFKFDLKRT